MNRADDFVVVVVVVVVVGTLVIGGIYIIRYNCRKRDIERFMIHVVLEASPKMRLK